MKYRLYNVDDVLLVVDNTTDAQFLLRVNDFTPSGDPQLVQFNHPSINRSYYLERSIILSDNPSSQHFTVPFKIVGSIGNVNNAEEINDFLEHNIQQVNRHNEELSSRKNITNNTNDLNINSFTFQELHKFLPEGVFVTNFSDYYEEELVYLDGMREDTSPFADKVTISDISEPLWYVDDLNRAYFELRLLNINQNLDFPCPIYSTDNKLGLADVYKYFINQGVTKKSDVELLYEHLVHQYNQNSQEGYNEFKSTLNQLEDPSLFFALYREKNVPALSDTEINKTIDTMREFLVEDKGKTPDVRSIQIEFHEGPNDHAGYYTSFDELQASLQKVYAERLDQSDHKVYMKMNLDDNSRINLKVYLGDSYGAFNPFKESFASYLSKGPKVVQQYNCSTEAKNAIMGAFTPDNVRQALGDKPSAKLDELSDLIKNQFHCQLNFIETNSDGFSSDNLEIYGVLDGTKTVFIGTKDEMELATQFNKYYDEMSRDADYDGRTFEELNSKYYRNFANEPSLVKKNYDVNLQSTSSPYIFGQNNLLKFKLYFTLSHDQEQLKSYVVTITGEPKNVLDLYDSLNMTIAKGKTNTNIQIDRSSLYERIIDQYINKRMDDELNYVWSRLSKDEQTNFLAFTSESNKHKLEGDLTYRNVSNSLIAFAEYRGPRVKEEIPHTALIALFIRDNYHNFTGEELISSESLEPNGLLIDFISDMKEGEEFWNAFKETIEQHAQHNYSDKLFAQIFTEKYESFYSEHELSSEPTMQNNEVPGVSYLDTEYARMAFAHYVGINSALDEKAESMALFIRDKYHIFTGDPISLDNLTDTPHDSIKAFILDRHEKLEFWDAFVNTIKATDNKSLSNDEFKQLFLKEYALMHLQPSELKPTPEYDQWEMKEVAKMIYNDRNKLPEDFEKYFEEKEVFYETNFSDKAKEMGRYVHREMLNNDGLWAPNFEEYYAFISTQFQDRLEFYYGVDDAYSPLDEIRSSLTNSEYHVFLDKLTNANSENDISDLFDNYANVNKTLTEQQVSDLTNKNLSYEKKVTALSLFNVPDALSRVITKNKPIILKDNNGFNYIMRGTVESANNTLKSKWNNAQIEKENFKGEIPELEKKVSYIAHLVSQTDTMLHIKHQNPKGISIPLQDGTHNFKGPQVFEKQTDGSWTNPYASEQERKSYKSLEDLLISGDYKIHGNTKVTLTNENEKGKDLDLPF